VSFSALTHLVGYTKRQVKRSPIGGWTGSWCATPRDEGGGAMRRGSTPGESLLTLLALGLVGGTAVALVCHGGKCRRSWWGLLHAKDGARGRRPSSPMLEAELLGDRGDQTTARRACLGRPVRVGGLPMAHSDPATFGAWQAQPADPRRQRFRSVIGCWGLGWRVKGRPVPWVEEANQPADLSPPAYEGLEESPNIVYAGGTSQPAGRCRQ